MENVAIQISAKDNTEGAFKSVQGRLSGLSKDASGVGDTIGAMLGKFNALGLAVGTALSFISLKSAIDTADAFSKMAQKTGVAVEQLRELNFAAALSDVSTEALGTGLRKLSVNMAAAAGGGKEQAAIFSALGLSVKDTSGHLKGADIMLSEVAGKFANFKDGPEKAALAVQLFGKAGADMIPLLNAGSSGLSEMAQEARDLGAVFSGEFGKQAEAFNDNLTRIGIASQRTGYAIAAELMPTLNSLAESFISAQKAGTGFGGTIGGVLRTGLEAVVIFVSDVAFVIKGVGTEIGGIIAQLNALGEGGGVFSAKGRAAWAAVGQAMREEAAKARAELDKFQYDLLNAGILTSKAGAGRGTATDPRLLGDTQTSAPIVKASAAATAKQISDYEKLTRAIAEKTAVAKLDLDTQEKLTEGQKMAEKFQSDLTLSTLKMTDAEVKATRAKLAGLVVIEKEIIAKAEATKRMVAEYQEELKTKKEISDEEVANDNARAAGITAVSNYADAIAEQNTYSQLELSLMGSTAVAREIALGQYRVELDLKKQIEAIDSNPGFNPDQKIIERARARAAASQATAGIETKAYTDEWKRTSDTINSTLTDALMRGFESGKDFAKNMRDTIVNMFKTMVLRPIISAVINPVAGALTGALGLSGAAQAAGTGSSVLSSVGTIAGLASTFGAGLKAGFAGLMGEAGFMGTLSAGTTALGAGNIAGGLGTLGGPLALATAAILGLSAIIKATSGETRNGAKYGVGSDGLAIKLEGPSGGEIAATQAQTMFNVAKSSIEGMLTAFGSKAVLTGFTAGLESSDNGKGFAYSTGKINGVAFGDTNTYMNSRGDKSQEQALKDYQKELSQSILEALQVTEDIPAAVAKMISDGLNGSEVKALSLEATSAILANVENLSKQVNTFGVAMTQIPFEALKNLSFDAAAGLIAAAGGFDKLDASLSGYYQNFYTQEEQRTQSITNTEAAFKALGLTMPALDESARSAYRAMVEAAAGQDLTVEANQKAYAALLSLQGPMSELAPAFSSVTTSLQNVATAAAEAAATMTSAWANVMQSRGVAANDVTRFTAQAAIDAAFTEFKKTDKFGIASAAQFQTITQADFKNYTSENQKLIATILTGFSDLSKANAPAVEAAQTYTQEAYSAPAIDTSIADAIAAITKGLTDAGVSLGVELLKAQGKTVEAMADQRAIDTAGYNAAQVALYDYNQTLRDQITALGEAAAAKQAFDGKLKSLQQQYDDQTLTQAQKRNAQWLSLNAQDPTGQLSGLQIAIWDFGDAAAKTAKDVSDAATAASAAAAAAKEQAANELATAITRNDWRDKLDVLMGSRTQEQLDTQNALAGVTDLATVELIMLVRGLEKTQAAAATAAAAAKELADQAEAAAQALASTNQGWKDQLDVLTGAQTDRSIALRDTTDESTRALMRQVYAQQDLKTASDKATEAAATLKAAFESLESARVSVANAYNSIKDRAASTAAGVVSAQEAITQGYLSAQDAQAAAQQNIADITRQAAVEMRGFADGIKDFILQMSTSDIGSGSKAQQLAASQADFAVAAAMARAGDKTALSGITGKASSLISAGKDQFANATDFARFTAGIGNTLSDLATLADGKAGPLAEAVDPMVKAQADLLKASQDLAKWGQAASASGASTSKTIADYLADWRTATAADAIAQADLKAAQLLTQDIDLKTLDVLGELKLLISSYNAAKVSVVDAGGVLPATSGKATTAAKSEKESIYSTLLGYYASAGGTITADVKKLYWEASGLSGAPAFATGTNYVPNDMMARIHEGEAIIPKAYNPYNPNAQQSSNNDTAAALRALADRLDQIEANTRATAGHTAGTDRKLARVIPGNALITEAA